MKRNTLIRHLSKQGCVLLREGDRHSIWKNKDSGEITAVPRHNEIKEILERDIHRRQKTLPLKVQCVNTTPKTP